MVSRNSTMKLTCMLLGITLMLPLSVQADNVNVVLLGGQSNMTGRASASGLPSNLASPQPDVLFYHDAGKPVTNEANQRTLTTLRSGSGTDFGPEVAFGRTIADGLPAENFALIKYAYGGTNLSNDWDPNTGSVYTTFRNTVTDGLAALNAAGHTYTITAMLWNQGESDAGRTTAQYEADLNEFIADIRSRYGANLPFFLSRLPLQQATNWNAGVYNIRAAQDNVAAADPYAYLIDTDGMSMKGDNLHFDTTGQVQMGTAFGEAYLNANAVPEPISVAAGLMGLTLIAARRRRA